MIRSIFYPFRPVRPVRASVPIAERDRLFREHWRLFFWLARRWYAWVVPFDRRAVAVEDIAAEFMRRTAQCLYRWKPEQTTFGLFVRGLAFDHARQLREKAMRQKRARHTLSQFAVRAGEQFDRLGLVGDPRQREPWELASEREGD